jgi:hypothetical protein
VNKPAAWQLVFCPTDSDWTPLSHAALIDHFASLGLLAESVAGSAATRFYIGEHFLQYISFMGCAPAVQFQPDVNAPEAANFIHWQVSPPFPQPQWIIDPQHGLPRCHFCQARIDNWREQISNIAVPPDTTRLRCPHCQRDNHLLELDWRQGAGYARQFVSVVNIYPKEALPTDALLQQLGHTTGIAWRYFYCQRTPIV